MKYIASLKLYFYENDDEFIAPEEITDSIIVRAKSMHKAKQKVRTYFADLNQEILGSFYIDNISVKRFNKVEKIR